MEIVEHFSEGITIDRFVLETTESLLYSKVIILNV